MTNKIITLMVHTSLRFLKSLHLQVGVIFKASEHVQLKNNYLKVLDVMLANYFLANSFLTFQEQVN